MNGPLPIQTSEVEAYARLRGLDRDQAVELDRFVGALDRVYFDWLRKQRESNTPKGSR